MQTSTWNPFLLAAFVMIALGGGLLTTIHPHISDGHWIGYQIFGIVRGFTITAKYEKPQNRAGL
jgi:hypothetical protein